MVMHVVKSGDTLSKIAKKYNTTVRAIQLANSTLIKDVNKIQVGWVLLIPDKSMGVSDTKFKNAFVKCLNDIENLQSFKDFSALL